VKNSGGKRTTSVISYRQIRQHHLEHERKPSPARGSKILVLGFAAIIAIGTALLTLPIATETPGRLSWLDALFTATSATTVTGLVVVGTEPTFSTFGEIVILFLIQVGGVGFITLSVLLFRLIGRRVTIYERTLLSQTLGIGGSQGVVQLTLTVLFTTVAIEFVGAFLMFLRWARVMDWPQAAYYAIFHAISAFCNAGFDLFQGLEDPVLQMSRTDPVIVIVMSLLITIGTLGITVIYDLIVWPRERHLSLHTRLVLPFTLMLIVVGTVMVMIDETYFSGHALSVFSMPQRWLVAFFTVVSSRTAGLTFISISDMGQASQLLIMIWMFIGGAPASMGGGVGLSTVAVVLVTLASIVRGYNESRAFERTLPTETILKAVAILTVSTMLVVSVTLVLVMWNEGDLFSVAFEVISAFSNTGYSLGITDRLSSLGRVLVAFTMFWGRLGPLTLVVALAQRRRQTMITYPEEKIIIG
jgi:trk system potassium uptake protein TrkH